MLLISLPCTICIYSSASHNGRHALLAWIYYLLITPSFSYQSADLFDEFMMPEDHRRSANEKQVFPLPCTGNSFLDSDGTICRFIFAPYTQSISCRALRLALQTCAILPFMPLLDVLASEDGVGRMRCAKFNFSFYFSNLGPLLVKTQKRMFIFIPCPH